MLAVVLVGGFGTRLQPLTLTAPKQMLPVVDRPMIEHVLAGLSRHGVDRVVLSLGYREDVFRAAYPGGSCAGVDLQYAVEPEPLDTAGAIRFAAVDAGIDQTFIVVNGDVLTDVDLTEIWNRHHRVGAEATISLTPVDDPSRYGVVPTDDSGRVLGFVEKPPIGEAPTNWINAGTYVMEPKVLDRIDADRRVSVEREIFPALVADNALWAVKSDSYWVDAGTPQTYLQVQLDLLDGVRGEALVGISTEAEIAAGAVVERSVVMARASVGAGALVRNSAVQSGALVAAGAVVEDSLIGPDAVIGAEAKVVDVSVIGAGELVDGGAVLTAARVPEPGR